MLASNGERILKQAAMATNGRFFFARTAKELQGFYQQVANELRTVSRYDFAADAQPWDRSPQRGGDGERIPAVAAPPQIELILDASGSMKRKLQGRMMIDIAKDAMVQIIEGLPDDLQVALRVYGHRIREGRPGTARIPSWSSPLRRPTNPVC